MAASHQAVTGRQRSRTGFYDSTAVKEREDKTSKCKPQGANTPSTPSTSALLAQLMNLNRDFSI